MAGSFSNIIACTPLRHGAGLERSLVLVYTAVAVGTALIVFRCQHVDAQVALRDRECWR